MSADPFALVSAFMMHVGARNIQFEFTDAQRRVLSHPVTKLAIMFGLFYITTRNLIWSVCLVGIYFILVNMLLNENHPLNIYSKAWLQNEGFDEKEQPEFNPVDTYYRNLQQLASPIGFI